MAEVLVLRTRTTMLLKDLLPRGNIWGRVGLPALGRGDFPTLPYSTRGKIRVD